MVQATNRNYVVKGLGQTKQTTGGIYIQQSDEFELAEIVSVGPDIEKPIPVGTRVIANWNTVFTVKLQGQPVFIISSDNILGIVE
jgi:co-chaperonin GroES (HSP10)|tara:strand:+ start:4042 stop:4296 length:255 start_codon:yes stop_codon:yes gene_type:complete